MKNSITILTTAVASLFVATAPIVASADHVPFRGVVEGFYGRPWGTEGRLSVLKFMGENVDNVTKDLKRPPFVWWNWPVNDYCRSSLLLGRTYGLEKCKIAGLVSNPMENCEANKIALYGFAKWCANPDSFDSKKCWDESFAKLYPDPKVAHAMRVFAEHNSDIGSDGCYSREESVSCAPLCAKAMEELDKSRALSDETAKGLRELIKEVHIACMALKIRLPKGRYDLG